MVTPGVLPWSNEREGDRPGLVRNGRILGDLDQTLYWWEGEEAVKVVGLRDWDEKQRTAGR